VQDVQLEARPLVGGLISRSVLRVVARYRDGRNRQSVASFVVKELEGEARREAAIYEALCGTHLQNVAPGLLGVERSQRAVRIYLQAITPIARWPWRRVSLARSVLGCLAELHNTSATLAPHVLDWDYETDLRERAYNLLDVMGRSRQRLKALGLTFRLSRLERLVRRLPTLRRRLEGFTPLSTAVLHGDVHPGNVLVRRRAGKSVPVLLDWGRARTGSPLEDVSQWLQSLGYWEPEVKRRHDSLLCSYLRLRGLAVPATRQLRHAYWLAAGSNSLSGALQYHVSVALTPESGERSRAEAVRAAEDQLRILRRADACLGPE